MKANISIIMVANEQTSNIQAIAELQERDI